MNDVEQFRTLWGRLEDQYDSGDFRAVGVRNEERSRLQFSQGILVMRQEPSTQPERRCYDEIEFHPATWDKQQVLQFLEHPERTAATLPGLANFAEPNLESVSHQNYPKHDWPAPLGHEPRLTGWPERRFFVRCKYPAGYASGPFHSPGMPVVATLEEFLESNLGFLPKRWESNSGVHVVLPDYRVAIQRIVLETGLVRVQLRPGLRRPSEYDVQIILVYARRGQHPSVRTLGDEFVAPMEVLPEELIVLVIENKTGEVHDWAKFGPLSTNLDPAIQVEYGSHETASLLEEGEGERLEFKEGADHRNRDEVLETVVAFSNTHGGRIVFGADDQGIPVGVAEPNLGRRLKDWCHDLVEPRVSIQSFPAEVGGKRLLVVHIPEGTSKPYFLKRKDAAFVRHGETDRKASREELQKMFSKPVSSRLNRFLL